MIEIITIFILFSYNHDMKTMIEECCGPELKSFIELHETHHTYAADKPIFEAGQKVKGLYIVKSGKVKVTKETESGTQLIVRLANEGTILGHRGFAGDWKYPISAYALTETTVSFLPIDIFNMIAKTNPDFTYHMLMFFAEELRLTEDSVAHLQVKNRVARFIFRNYEAFGFDEKTKGKLSFTLARKDLALQAGTTYETTIRAIANLAKEKIVKIDGKDLIILSLPKLKKEAMLTL